MKKICSILILIVLLLNSSVMVLISQAVEAVSEMLSTQESNIQSMQEVTLEKYINYANNLEKGTMVQLKVEVGLQKDESEEVYINEMTTIVECPKILENIPTRIEVIGKDAVYENGIITILEKYESKLKYEGKKEYTIILFYDEECYTETNIDRILDTKVAVTQVLENTKTSTTLEKNITVQGEAVAQSNVSENIGTIVSVDYNTETIYNGYINSNIENGTDYDTEYQENTKVMISNKNIAETFIITSNNVFGTQSEEISNNNNLQYKGLKIEKSKIEDILGENGEIRILGQDNTILDVINNEVQTNEDGNYVYTFTEPVQELKLQIANIAREGIIEFNTTKIIKSTIAQNVYLVKNILSVFGTKTTEITTMDDLNQNEITSQETNNVYLENLQNDITIQDATHKISMTLNKQIWTNNAQNDLTITATLHRNKPENKLFENPTILIELPEEVEKIILKDVQVLHDLELNKLNTIIETNEFGKQIIKISLSGKQTQYLMEDNITKGTNILISATVILKQNISSKESTIKMLCDDTMFEQPINLIEKNQVALKSPSTQEVEGSVVNSNGLKINTKLVAGDKILSDNETIYEEQVLKYEVKITNTTDSNIEDIKIIGKVPEGMTFVNLVEGTYSFEHYEFVPDDTIREKEIEVGTLVAGQTETYYYEVKVNNLLDTEEEKETTSDVKVFIGDTEVSAYTLTSIIKQAEIAVELGVYTGRTNRNELVYYAKISNISSQIQENVNISLPLAKNMQITDISIWDDENNYEKNVNNNIISIKFNNVKIKGLDENKNASDNEDSEIIEEGPIVGITHEPNEIIILIDVNIIDLEENEDYSWKINTAATVTSANGNIYKSNENRASGYVEAVQVNQTSDKSGEILQAGDEITYTFTINNLGKVIPECGEFTAVNFKDYIPNELEVISVNYTSNKVLRNIDKGNITWTIEPINVDIHQYEIQKINENDNTNNARLDLNLNIRTNESATIIIKARTKTVYVDTEIQNYGIVTGEYIKTKQSNIIQNTIKEYKTIVDVEDPKPTEPENPDKPVEPVDPENPDVKKYTISGLAWIDENENGQRDNTEQKISGMEVMLFDIENNKYLQDENGNTITKITNGIGQYLFENVKQGKYYVIFKYNNENYEITTYKKPGVSIALNSDAMPRETIINGNTVLVGVTDIIELTSNNSNIDIGLIKNKIFDLKVEKYIERITVQNNKGTKHYNYNNEKITKIEIPEKQIVGTTIVIEYRIVVTNVGELAGTVNELIDVMPANLEFKSELNSNWYKTVGNNLSNTNISTKEIQPGESIEEEIVLTKTLDGSIETYSNIAKIGISDNVKHIADKNIENDSDKVEIILSVKTGSVGEYIGTIIGTIVVLAIMLAIVIVLVKKNKNKLLKILCFVLVMFITVQIETTINADGDISIGDIVLDINDHKDKWYQAMSPDGDVEDIECQKPGFHFCKQDKFDIKRIVTEESSIEYSGDGNIDIQLEKDNIGKVTFKQVGDRNIYGPFQVRRSLDGSITISVQGITNINIAEPTDVEYKIIDGNGTTEISNIPSGTPFYISVSSNVKALTNVSITIKKETTVTCKRTIKYYYEYTPSASQPPHTGQNPDPITGKLETVTITLGSQIQNHIGKDREKEIEMEETVGASKTVSWGIPELPKAIQVKKVDYDNNETVLSNIKFILRNDTLGRYVKQDPTDLSITYVVEESEATIFTTNAQGIIEVKGLFAGSYKFIEKENPYHGYKNNKNLNDVRTVAIEEDKAVIRYTAKNRKLLGNIDIVKENNANSAIKLNNIEFVLLNDKGEYVKVEVEGRTGFQTGTGNKLYGTVRITRQEYTTNKEEATIFVTDANGEIHIRDIALESASTDLNNNDINSYIIREIYNPHYGYELDGEYITWEVDGENKGTGVQLNFVPKNKVATSITVKNEQKYVKISGYVWEDMPEGKDNVRDGVYGASVDRLVEGVKVILNNSKTGKKYEKWTDSKGAYIFGGKDGETYLEENILLRDIENYYIEIIYNGMKYTNVIPQVTVANGSKMIEGKNRETYNKKYETIGGETAKGSKVEGETEGYALDQNGNRTEIKYIEPGANESQITYTEGQTYADEKLGIKLNEYYALNKYHISATTRENGYNLRASYQTNDAEIKNINLGIFEREQVDLAISSDIEDLTVGLNGYTHTYHYATRNKYLKNDGAFNVGVKFGDKYLNRYTRTVYQSAVTYFAEDRNNNKVNVDVIYKITMKNESSTLSSKFNQINNYYDKEYTPQEVYYKEGEEKVTIEDWSIGNQTYANDRLKVLHINLRDKYVEAGEVSEIYIRYKVSDEAVLGLLNADATLENATEIASYSTYTKVSNTEYANYASIDEDSAPNNAIIEIDEKNKIVKESFEDDTDMAPSLILQAEKNNVVSGTVFEDSQTEESKNINERLGNGIYEKDKENVVVNAKVELIEVYDDNDGVDENTKGKIKYDADGNPIIAKLYQTVIGENGKPERIIKDAVTYTDDNGNYRLVGIIPDGYAIRYTYGEGTKIKEKGTTNYIEIDARDYKSTIITSNEIRRAINIQPDTAIIDGRGNYNWNALKEKDANGNIIRYSDAADEITQRMEQEKEEEIINYTKSQEQVKDMTARTASFIIGVEFENINSSANVYLRDTNGDIVVDENGEPMPDPNFYSENENIDFGIILRPEVDLKLDKNLTNMSIQLGNGQMLVSGNPYKEDLPYTRAVDDNIYVDMDTDLIQGAALKIEYEIKLINDSEVDYKYTTKDAKGTAGRRYYYFGDRTGAEKVNKYVHLVGDYLDEELVYDINEMNEGLTNGWEITTAQKLYDEGKISKEVKDALIEQKQNIFTTKEFNDCIETSNNPNESSSKTLKFTVSKLLGAKDELVFTNDAEILEIYAIARKPGKGDITPGNLVPQKPVEQDEDSVKLLIMPPTGGNDYTTYIITAIGSLLLIVAGVVLIKKSVSGGR